MNQNQWIGCLHVVILACERISTWNWTFVNFHIDGRNATSPIYRIFWLADDFTNSILQENCFLFFFSKKVHFSDRKFCVLAINMYVTLYILQLWVVIDGTSKCFKFQFIMKGILSLWNCITLPATITHKNYNPWRKATAITPVLSVTSE